MGTESHRKRKSEQTITTKETESVNENLPKDWPDSRVSGLELQEKTKD